MTNSLQAVIGYALSGYYVSAHITTGNTARLTLTLVETDLVIFSSTFPAGTFDIPNTPITAANGGTVFLTITSQNQVFTQMNVVATIFHTVTALPFFWAGVGILGLTGLLTLAIFYQHTAAGTSIQLCFSAIVTSFVLTDQCRGKMLPRMTNPGGSSVAHRAQIMCAIPDGSYTQIPSRVHWS